MPAIVLLLVLREMLREMPPCPLVYSPRLIVVAFAREQLSQRPYKVNQQRGVQYVSYTLELKTVASYKMWSNAYGSIQLAIVIVLSFLATVVGGTHFLCDQNHTRPTGKSGSGAS